jgi:hypothetical protein
VQVCQTWNPRIVSRVCCHQFQWRHCQRGLHN